MSHDSDRANSKPPSLDRLSVFWRRINDHKVVQWSVAYVALAYGIQHGVELTSDAFEWPHAVVRVSMLLLVLGLPLVMTCAWYHGERASRRISGPELTIISILLVIGSLFFYVVVRPSEQIAGATARQASIASGATSATQSGGITVAVLPFVNLSSDKEQEFFSDGMTDEIMTALAKVSALRVVGRESAFQFKERKTDMHAVGQALGAAYLVEGSVRKAGEQVRITAQLVQADNGVSLWTESYDRELKNIFATQSDIAQAIAVSLRVPLGLKQGQSLIPSRTANLESYQNYLRAKALFRSRGARGEPQAESLLEMVVARDPDYAPAWGLLAEVYSHVPNLYLGTASAEELRRITETALQKVRAASGKAMQLDPRNAEAYLALGYAEESHGLWLDAEQSFKQGLALDPLNPDALSWYREFLGATGRVREAVAVGEQLRELEPLVPVFNANTAAILWVAGENGNALTLALGLPPGFFRGIALPRIYATMGRTKEAADALLSLPREPYPAGTVETAARLLLVAPEPAGEKLPYLGDLGFVYLYTSHPELALEFYEREVDAGWFPAHDFMTLPQADFASARKSGRFKNLMRKSGLVDYWRARGWPQFCHPTTGEDFACE